jgi:glycosyltransferase involved in cell wall biosynthesis
MAAGGRIFLIGINFEPEETGIGPYTSELARHLDHQGHAVTVITGMPHYPQWKIAGSYRGRFRSHEHIGRIDVRRIWHHVPRRQSALGRGAYELSFFLQAICTRTTHRPSCVIGVVPSLGGGLAAAVVARRHGVPVGLIFQDLMGQAAAQSGMPGGRLAALPARKLEAWTARQAKQLAIVAEAFRRYLMDAGVEGTRIVHIPNWSRVDRPTLDRAVVRKMLGWPEDIAVALHAGNMGYKQDLHNVVAAGELAWSKGRDLRIVLMGEGNDRRSLEAQAVGVPNVSFLDAQPSTIFMDVLGAADVLLLNERATVMDMSLPSKLTSYFLAGRPVVAAVRSGGSTSTELSRSGGALVVDAGDPAALLEAIERAIRDEELSRDLVRCATAYAEANLDRVSSLADFDAFVKRLQSEQA